MFIPSHTQNDTLVPQNDPLSQHEPLSQHDPMSQQSIISNLNSMELKLQEDVIELSSELERTKQMFVEKNQEQQRLQNTISSLEQNIQ